MMKFYGLTGCYRYFFVDWPSYLNFSSVTKGILGEVFNVLHNKIIPTKLKMMPMLSSTNEGCTFF